MKRVVIADIHSNNNRGICTGHYYAVAQMYYTILKDYCDARIASGPIYQKKFNKEQMIMLPYDMNAQGNYLVNRLKALLNARKLFKECRNDIIILQDGRPMTNHFGILLFCRPRTNLYLIKYTTGGHSSLFERIIYKLIKGRIKGIICPNEKVSELYGLPSCIIPDYISTSVELPSIIPFNQKRFDFSVVGRLNEEKGVVETAAFFRDKPYRVLIAGQAPVDYAQKLKSVCEGSTSVDLRLGYVSDEDYKDYINNSKYCVLNYQDEYSRRSSGVVYDILFAGVPVVGCNCEALRFIGERQLGYLFDSFESIDLEKIVSGESYETFIDNIREYLKVHNDYKRQLLNFLGIS